MVMPNCHLQAENSIICLPHPHPPKSNQQYKTIGQNIISQNVEVHKDDARLFCIVPFGWEGHTYCHY